MSKYFENLLSDYEKFGLPVGSKYSLQPKSWLGIYYAIAPTRTIGQEKASRVDTDKLRTQLGKRIGQILDLGITFDEYFNYEACGVAESKLIEGLQPEIVAAKTIDSPLLVTQKGNLVGIIKNILSGGEPTCYGLKDIPSIGLLSGTISTPVYVDPVMETQDRTATTAWKVDVSSFSKFVPIRFSRFALPLTTRYEIAATNVHMPETDMEMLVVSHESIAARAAELAVDAQPFVRQPTEIEMLLAEARLC